LADVEDTGRIAQKLILGRGDPNDLLAVKKTIQAWTAIMNRISEEKKIEASERSVYNPDEWESLDVLMSRMTELRELSERIGLALEDGCVKDDPQPTDQVAGVGDESGNIIASDDEDTNLVWRQGYGKWNIKPQ
jgi:DNA mismatch repair ATPase MutS